MKKSQVSPAYSSKISESSAGEGSSHCGSMVLEDIPISIDKKGSSSSYSISDSEPREK